MYEHVFETEPERSLSDRVIYRYYRRFRRAPKGFFITDGEFGTKAFIVWSEWRNEAIRRWHRKTGGDYQI